MKKFLYLAFLTSYSIAWQVKSSQWVLTRLKIDIKSSHEIQSEYSSRVRRFNLSTWVESECRYENSTWWSVYQWVQAFFDINEELQQLKHHQSHFVFIIILFIKVKSIFALINNFLSLKIIISVTVVSTVSSFLSFSFLDESMNLSFIIIIIQDKTLIISEIKKICNKWKLYYYCKLQHSSKIIKECSNKKFFTLHIMNIYDNDIISIDEKVSLFIRKV